MEISRNTVKAADGYLGNASLNTQRYSPQMAKRKLTSDEEAAVAAGESRWLPTLFQNYGTPVTDMMASPLKMSLLTGIPVAAIVAALASNGKMTQTAAGQPLLTGLAAGVGGGLGTYWHQQSRNKGLKDMLTRLPEHATKRDLMADSAYQADLDRSNALTAARFSSFRKSAGIGTTLGILGGLLSGRGDDRLRSAGRGAIKGFGTDMGAATGAALGTGLGLLTGAPALGFVGGGIGGGMLGHSLASSAIGPYETEEEKFERMLSAREAAKEKMKTAYTFGAKVAQSACTPCAMPNAPTNKKKTTSDSPAVLEAGQASEEIGKPETTKTEHSAAKAKLPEEGVKSALEFGRKVAAVGLGVTPTIARAPLFEDPPPVAKPKPEKDGHPGLMSVLFPHPDNPAVKERARSGLMANLPNPPERPSGGWRPPLSTPQVSSSNRATSPRADKSRTVSSTWDSAPPPAPSTYAYGMGPASASAQAAPAAKTTTGQGGKKDWKATNSAEAQTAVNNALGPVTETPPPGEGGSNLPWMIGGGLGAAGLGALLYHLATRQKKKRRDEDDG